MAEDNFQEKANFIWQVVDDILRGSSKPHEYGDVILPFVVLRLNSDNAFGKIMYGFDKAHKHQN